MFTREGSDPGRVASKNKSVKNHLKGILCFLAFFTSLTCSSLLTYAQAPVKVSGTVVDEKDLSLPGVTIKLKNGVQLHLQIIPVSLVLMCPMEKVR